MGLTTLPEVGTGEALGPVKVSRPFAAPDPLRDITVAEHNAAMAALEDVCAEVGLHDGSTVGSLVERVTALEGASLADMVTSSIGGLTSGNVVIGNGDRVVEDSGVALIDMLDATADALHPLVQTAHTSATKTLAAGDAGDIIPLNAASNAIEVTIPHTLFAAFGTGRAWSCGFYVTSVAGGAVTFVGSGGIVIKYGGKKPSATAIAAHDTIFVTVVSATLAFVHISAEIP